MSKLITYLIPTPIANAAYNLLKMKKKEVFYSVEEFMEEDGFDKVERCDDFNTEGVSTEEYSCIAADEDDFNSIIPMLKDWYDITEYPEVYQAEHNLYS